jgi:hypothetical protein
MTPSKPVSPSVYSAARPECVPEPEPRKPKHAEDDDDDDDDSSDEKGVLAMTGLLSLLPPKLLRGTNRVMIGPGEIVRANMQVPLDNGQLIILDGYVGVVKGEFVVNADQMLRDRDLLLGTNPQIKVDGLLNINPEKLMDTAYSSGIVSESVEITVVPNQMIDITPQFGPFVEATRYMMVSNDLPMLGEGLFRAHADRRVQHRTSTGDKLIRKNRRPTSVKDRRKVRKRNHPPISENVGNFVKTEGSIPC